MKQVVLLKPYGSNPTGTVLSLVQADIAASLVKRGIAREMPVDGAGLAQETPDAGSLSRRPAKLQAHGRKG